MKTLIYSLLILSFASANQRNINSSLDVRVPLLNYERPSSGTGNGGSVIFSKFSMDRQDMVLRVDNKDKIFDTTILVRPNFVGFRSKLLNLGFAIEEESALKDILEGLLKEGRVRFDSKKVQVTADQLIVRQPTTNVEFKNMRLYCKKHPEYPELDMPGFLGACLNDAQLNGQNEGSLTDASIEFINTSEEGTKIELHSLVELLTLSSENIHLKGQRTKVKIDDTFKVQLEKVDFNCAKEPDLIEFVQEDFQLKCMNSLRVDVGTILVEDDETKSVIYLEPENVQINERRLGLDVPTIQMHGPEGSTIIRNLSLDCYRSPKRIDFVIGDVVDDCLSDGEIKISSVHSNSSKDKEFDDGLFDQLIDDGVRADNEDVKKSTATDIELALTDDIVELSARTKLFGLNIDFFAKGRAELIEDKMKVAVELTDVKLPWYLLGKKSKGVVMFAIKRFMTSDMIEVKDGKIIITLSQPKEEK